MLIRKDYSVKCFLIRGSSGLSADCEANFDRLNRISRIQELQTTADFPQIPQDAIIIDALFGSGLSRELEGFYSEVVDLINQSETVKVALDMPSGLFCDRPSTGRSIIRASRTFTFQVPKFGLLLPENSIYVGDVSVLDIGLHQGFLDKVESSMEMIETEEAAAMLKSRQKFSHKGDFGKVMIIAGSYGKMGAAVLCSRACLRTGTGLLTVHVPECGYEIMQLSLPEAMTSTDSSLRCFSDPPEVSAYDVIGIGPGLGTNEKTVKAFKELLNQYRKPMVLDADALNIMARNRELLELLPPNSIITPHPKEFERIAGTYSNDFEKIRLQLEFSRKNQVVVVLKGAYTSISNPEGKLIFNSSGNPGMATGGSGDALTGIITSLAGQKYPPFQAAVLGTYLHGLAADLAAKDKGVEAMLPEDLISRISCSFKNLHLLNQAKTK